MSGGRRAPRSLRRLLGLFLGVLGVLVAALVLVASFQQRSEAGRARAENRRNESFRLADSLRQSSNDLTLMVRLYVSTGDPRYRANYDEILAIRNGTVPRPLNEDSSLWDRVLSEGKDFVRYGPPVALVDRMRAAAFTDEEFDLLNTALRTSDALTVIEVSVMDKVATRVAAGVDDRYLADVAGDYEQLVNAGYLSRKGQIMSAIGDFVAAVDQRTLRQVDRARAVSRALGYAQLGVLALLVAVGMVALAVLRRVAIRPLSRLVAVARRLAHGDYAQRASLEAVAELEELAGAFDDMAGAVQRDIGRREQAERDAVEARQLADEANQAKSIFLASMSHEVRTPMTGVLGMLEVLAHTDLSDEQRSMLGVAGEAAQSLLNVTGDVLDLSKIEAGRLELAPTTICIADLVRQVAGTYVHTASTKGLVLEWSADSHLAPAHVGDPLRIRQVLSNFVSNALKFTDDGSVALRARSLGAGDGDGSERVELAVVDTGVGVSPEQQERLFREYTQADATTAQRFGGTGLGLSICRRLAQLMGGTVSMDSAVDAGTTMRLLIDLPVGDPVDLPQTGPGAMAGLRPGPAGAPTVLLVEDHPVNRRVLAGQLRVVGFDVDTAENGREALHALEYPGDYVLVLTDVNMPVMDGYTLAAAIRTRQASGIAALPVVGLSANVTSEERARCLASGMDDFMGKPTTIAALAATLRRWLPDLAWVESPAPPPHVRGSGVLDLSCLEELTGGNPEVGATILKDYLGSTAHDLADLGHALESGEIEGVRRAAHRLKGASQTVGALAVADLAAQIEEQASQGRLAGVDELLAVLRTAVAAVASAAVSAS